MADGRVITGFSLPYVALYAHTGTTITYSSGSILARGVSVSVEAEDAGDDNIFYANNGAAEIAPTSFKGADATLTVDGLLSSAEALIFGLPSADGDGFYNYTGGTNPPYVGIGFVCRYMSEGSTSYVPVVLTKAKFNLANLSAATQEEDIDWQTQELVAKCVLDDSATPMWKRVGTAQSTEASAVSLIKTALQIS